ncbi:MAG TPA: pentapeptide repeat-containing protein [Nodosilinea sp.]|nr:pentapeptide repeat-containing protein [Nodosilinea sp.]
MDFEEIAVFVNQVAVERKGRALKDVERLVLKGAWENKTYSAMATPTAGYTEDYLKKDVGPKLWQLLSDLVDSDMRGMRVTKRNIQNVLQTWAAQELVGAQVPAPGPQELPPPPALTVRDSPRIDLTDCVGREADLATLTEWVLGVAPASTGPPAPRCRTVVLWGVPGVGKTTLAALLVAAIAPHQQCGYLALPPQVDAGLVLAALTHWLDPAREPAADPLAAVDWVLEQLEQRSVLLILDGMEALFDPQALAGRYRPDTAIIQHLFHQGAERHHQSCLVWVSREKPADLAQVQGLRVREYRLDDLAAAAAQPLLTALGAPAVAAADWAALLARYGSHPLMVRGLGASLREMYQGQPHPLLQATPLAVPSLVQHCFSPALDRLLPAEWALLYWLALAQEPVALDDLNSGLLPPLDDQVVQSALGRGWVQGAAGAGLTLSLKPAVQALVLERLQRQLLAELEAESFNWLHRLPLVTMTAREVVQARQQAAMLGPLAEALRQRHATAADLAAKGERLLAALPGVGGQPGYAASNLIHLCQYLGLGVSGANFANLAIWQGDLRRVSLQGADFSQAQFSDTAFATALGRQPVAAFSPDGRHLATGDHEGRLLLWDLSRGKLIWMFDEDQSQGVRSLAFSPQGDLLAVGTETGKIWLWPVGATYQTDILDAHRLPVLALAFSPDGRQLASGDDEGKLCLWEVASGFLQGCLAGHQGPIHSLAYSASGDRLVSGGDDQRACLWNVADQILLKDLQARSTGAIRTAGFLPDPNDPDCLPMPFAAGYDDRCLTIWNLETGLPCWILPADVQALPAMALSPNGRYLVCSRQDFAVALWDIPGRQLLHTLPSLGAPVWALAFSADSRYFVTGSDYTIKLWHARRGQCWRSFLSQAHPVRCLAFATGPASGTILTGHDDTHLRLWQLHPGSPYASGPRTLAGHDQSVCAVALSADGQWLASSADDLTIRLWSAATGQSQWAWVAPAPITLLSFSPDGQWLVGAGLGAGVALWDTATGSAAGELEGAPESPSALTFSPDGQWIVVGGRDGAIGLWQRGQHLRQRLLVGHQSQVHSLVVSPDGATLASASHDGTVRWWSLTAGDTAQGQWRHPAEHWLQGVALGPDGEILAIASQAALMEVWAVATNQHRHTLRGHSQAIWQVSASPTHLMSASQDDEIRVWSLESGLCQQTLRPDRPYEGVNIRGATGLSDTEERMLKSLGAIVSY